MKMSKAISRIVSGAGTITHSLVIPFFILIFTIYYRPYVVYEHLSMDNASFTFNATILFSIILVSLSITRGWLYLFGRFRGISTVWQRRWPRLWSMCEAPQKGNLWGMSPKIEKCTNSQFFIVVSAENS